MSFGGSAVAAGVGLFSRAVVSDRVCTLRRRNAGLGGQGSGMYRILDESV
jgi:hypothetical protein